MKYRKYLPLQPTTYLPTGKAGNLQPTQSGQAMMVATLFFLAVAISTMFGISTPVLRQGNIVENFVNSRQSYSASESGVEDILYRLKKGKQVSSMELLAVGSSTATTTITDVGSNEKQVNSIGNFLSRFRKTEADVTIASGTSFNYGVQVGNGGFFMENSGSVIGNIYSNGPVYGQNSNIVKGDVVSAGPGGFVNGIHATSSVYAHTIRNSDIDKDAYYQSISNTSVDGTKYPGSVDKQSLDLPIPDSLIAQWENYAASGGTVNCPSNHGHGWGYDNDYYEIKSNTTLGPVKINCDLVISGNPTVTLTGPMWVVGTIHIKNSPTIKISPSLGNKSVAIIADNPSHRHHFDHRDDSYNDSQINIEDSATFQGSGGVGSYVLMVSQNDDAEQAHDDWWHDWQGHEWHSWWHAAAINVENSASGAVLLYAGRGEVLLKNSVSVKEVTAYKVHIKNSAKVTYDTGLANLIFSSGPSGAWTIKSWKEQ